MFDDITERVSQMRRPGEDDMSYYERRYQERVSPYRELIAMTRREFCFAVVSNIDLLLKFLIIFNVNLMKKMCAVYLQYF